MQRIPLTHTHPSLLVCLLDACVLIVADGPFAASLPDALTPILNKYAITLEFELGGDQAFLFHPPNGSNDRAMESSAWTGWVKRLFKHHHGAEVAPKTLRSVFITWLRDQTTTPEILKSAAHAMKHSEQRQASTDYDQESDDRKQHLKLEPSPCCVLFEV